MDDNQNQEHESNLSVYAADACMGIGENPMECCRHGTYLREQSEYRHPFRQTPHHLLDIQHQAFQVLALGMIDVYRMVGRLRKLMQYPHLATRDSRSREYRRAE